MKKILNFLGTVTLIWTSTTSLVACNKPTNNIPCEKENHGNWKQQCSSNKPFNNEDRKWYIVIWRGGGANYDWRITKILNYHIKIGNIEKSADKNYSLQILDSNNGKDLAMVTRIGSTGSNWGTLEYWIDDYREVYFKSVYRWEGVYEPEIPNIDSKTGEITDWKEDKEDKKDKKDK